MSGINPQNTNLLTTKDLFLSSFLIVREIKLLNTEEKKGVVFFQFKDSPELQKLIAEFFTRSSVVEPMQYLSQLKKLRRIIGNKLNGNADLGGSRT